MPTVNDVFLFLNRISPVNMKLDFDNVGFLAGFIDREVKKVMVSLDVTDEVVGEATEKNAELIVSHHPLIFNALKSVTDCDSTGRKVVRLVENGISAICMHTNLDAAEGGVNDVLAAELGIEKVQLLSVDGTLPDGRTYGIGRIGELPESAPMSEFLPFIKSALKSNGLRYHNAGIPVKRVAIVAGSGGDSLQQALLVKCDTFISADLKYGAFLTAREEGINLIDADHFCTENVVCPVLRSWLTEEFKGLDVEISSRHSQTAKFI